MGDPWLEYARGDGRKSEDWITREKESGRLLQGAHSRSVFGVVAYVRTGELSRRTSTCRSVDSLAENSSGAG